jgi:hypothetical protein
MDVSKPDKVNPATEANHRPLSANSEPFYPPEEMGDALTANTLGLTSTLLVTGASFYFASKVVTRIDRGKRTNPSFFRRYGEWASTRKQTFPTLSIEHTGTADQNLLTRVGLENNYRDIVRQQNRLAAANDAAAIQAHLDQGRMRIKISGVERGIIDQSRQLERAKEKLIGKLDQITLADHINLVDETLSSTENGIKSDKFPRHNPRTLSFACEYRTMAMSPQSTLSFSETVYMPKIGSPIDLSEEAIRKRMLSNPGTTLPVTAENGFKRYVRDVRANEGVPAKLFYYLDGDHTAHFAQFPAGEAPVFSLNHFQGTAKLLDFEQHTNQLASLSEAGLPRVLNKLGSGFVNSHTYNFTPPVHAVLGRELSTIQQTALFETEHPWILRTLPLYEKLGRLKKFIPFASKAFVLGTAAVALAYTYNAYMRDNKLYGGIRTWRTGVDGVVNIFENSSLNLDITNTFSATLRSLGQKGVTELDKKHAFA